MAHSRCIRSRCLLMLAAFLVVVGVMMPLLSGTSFAKSTTPLRPATSSAKSWNIVSSPNQTSNNDNLSDVVAVSASDVWAVGTYFGNGGNPHTLIEQWNGTSWSIVASPNLGSIKDVLSGVARVPGSSNVWAVGSYSPSSIGQTSTLIEYYS